jgi:hypothetical protein
MAPIGSAVAVMETATSWTSNEHGDEAALAGALFGVKPLHAAEDTTETGGVVISLRPSLEEYLDRAGVVPASRTTAHAYTVDSARLREQFRSLARHWQRESAHLSSVTKMAMLPSYQRIIGLGPGALPLILERLEREPNHWFWALEAIAGTNPVSPEHAGRVRDMAQDWLRWARKSGIIA